MPGMVMPAATQKARHVLQSIRRSVRAIDLNPETAFKRKRPPPAPRCIVVNEPLPQEAFDAKGRPQQAWVYPTNQVRSAKYTIYNFVFKNLLEQFRRVANIFFLVLVILQFFPQFATISPGVAMLPLLIVLAVTMVKDGYEDIKRHQSDRAVNVQLARVLTGSEWHNANITESKSLSTRVIFSKLRELFTPKPLRRKREAHAQEKAAEAEAMGAAEPGAFTEHGGGLASPPPMSPIVEGEAAQFATDPGAPPDRGARRASGARPSMHSERTADSSVHRRHSMLSERFHHRGDAPARWKARHWEDVHVGDIVRLKNNEAIPADIVVCATSEEDGSCYVETKNLDGEINLKTRYAVPELMSMCSATDCLHVRFDVEVEPQNTDMYRFNARVAMHNETDDEGQPLQCAVTLSQVLLRGCSLRNTDWVIGVVVMTGADSKIVLNSGDTPSKRSVMEHEMNKMVYINLGIIGIIGTVCAIADSVLEKRYFRRAAYWEYAATHSDDNPSINGLISFANSFITFQNFVPIALYISFEVVRTIQALFIFEDHDMYYDKTQRRTSAKSWNLSDELGQVSYVISDKTGTLTQNLMIFRECAIHGAVYQGDRDDDWLAGKASREESDSLPAPATEKPVAIDDAALPESARVRVHPANPDVPPFVDRALRAVVDDTHDPKHPATDLFFHTLSLCHTVHIARTDERNVIMYKAESPDEQALVQAAADFGYVYCGRQHTTIELQVPHAAQRERYELLHTLEFSSARKRMSVVLRRLADGKIVVFAKGADAMIYSRLAPGQEDMQQRTDRALEEFANRGLRTLCLAYKEPDPDAYAAWSRRYHDASLTTDGREERMEELANAFEQNFQLVGATAIEDRLQDGVPDTIADLKRAGISVWVATGDKLETAIAIGYSTKLLSNDMNLVIVRGGAYGTRNSAYDQLEQAIERFFGTMDSLADRQHPPPPLEPDAAAARAAPASLQSRTSLVGEDNGERPGGYALVIDGHALGSVLDEPHSRELLLHVAARCRAVVCCRVSPLQKALIVHFIRSGFKGITLAIGDGANDVSMIQAAHVGVGVAGEEGLQAVNSSDYAIGQFRFLKRLVLVHGHWSYYRNSKMINLFFYKQVVQTGTLFWFQIYCAWSTTQAMEYVYLLLYNVIWTVAPAVGVGIFDRNLSDHILLQVPELYRRSREGRYFGVPRFLGYSFDGLVQSVILFFFFMYFYDATTPRHDGYSIDQYEPTTGMTIATVFVANLYCGLDALSWTWWIVFAVAIGPFVLFVFAPIYAAFPPSLIWTYSWGNNELLYASGQFWFANIFTVFLCLLPRLLYEYYRMLLFPTDTDIVRVIDIQEPNHDYVHDARMPGLRAAQAYESEADHDGDTSMRSAHGDSYPLMPTASRASSTHYDMSTGRQSVYRGYSFDATDHPLQRERRAPLRRLGHALNPTRLLTRRRRRRSDRRSSGGTPAPAYERADAAGTDGPAPDSAADRLPSLDHSEAHTAKRESFVDDTVLDGASDVYTPAHPRVRRANGAGDAPPVHLAPDVYSNAAHSPQASSLHTVEPHGADAAGPRGESPADYAPAPALNFDSAPLYMPHSATGSTVSETFFTVEDHQPDGSRRASRSHLAERSPFAGDDE
ncbi:P-type phospholipid transporter [Malassezia sp. CBS 17886]|nr:P-type phospholipid transporter [Malassezia sp. CBS 17886]